MGERSYGLHLNGVHFLQLKVSNARRIDDLISECFIVGMTHIKSSGGEGERLHLNISLSDAIHEAGLADVRKATHQQGPLIRVYGRQSSHVLPYFL